MHSLTECMAACTDDFMMAAMIAARAQHEGCDAFVNLELARRFLFIARIKHLSILRHVVITAPLAMRHRNWFS